MSSSKYRNRSSARIACSSSSNNKRARRASAAAISDASPWPSLCEDLVRLIGWTLLAGDLRDYVRFRAVCRRWRSGSVCPRGRGIVDPRFYPRRWMMLPEGCGLHPGHGKLGGYIRFFNLSTGAFVRAKLPLFRNHCILDSVDGLLLLQRDQDTAIRLLHPFTGDIADLPPLATLPRLPGVHYHMKDTCSYFRSVSATSFSVSADGVISVVIAISVSLLAFATSRDQQWHLGGCRLSGVWRPISFHGKLYKYFGVWTAGLDLLM